MGFFDHLQKGGAISLQAQKPQIRKVVQTRPTPPSRSSSSRTPDQIPSRNSPFYENGKKTRGLKSRSVSTDVEPPSSKRRLGTPSRTRKRPTPEQRLSSDDDDDVNDTDTSFDVRKRARLSDGAVSDPERRVRSVKAFSEEGSKSFPMVHAADIASLQKTKYKRAFGEAGKPAHILLQYPSASQKERYGF